MLEVICKTTGMGFAAVARVTETTWMACEVHDEISFGLKPGGELELKTTICDEIRQSCTAVIIDHVEEDSFYKTHHTPLMYGFQSYISVPIFRKNGEFFGTLCAIDPHPAKLNNPTVIGMFQLFTDLISFHLDAGEQLLQTQAKLEEEKKVAELRDRFIAILGHDLRNPISSVMLASEMLLAGDLDENNRMIVQTIQRSAFRMMGLIENILDFAQGQLGGGIVLQRKDHDGLQQVIEQVIAETRNIWPKRVIDANISFNGPVNCDSDRVAQLFSNLMGNAMTHSLPDTPIEVIVTGNDQQFVLDVVNEAAPITQRELNSLFRPFFRGKDKSGKEGLGLGLFISSEIAKAHRGTLRALAETGRVRFSLTIPQKVDADKPVEKEELIEKS
ncbi:Bacteriophytochrome [compost metagenome]